MENGSKNTAVDSILSDVKMGKPCHLLLSTGAKIVTANVIGWLKNIKGEVYIRTTDETFVGVPGCDSMLLSRAVC